MEAELLLVVVVLSGDTDTKRDDGVAEDVLLTSSHFLAIGPLFLLLSVTDSLRSSCFIESCGGGSGGGGCVVGGCVVGGCGVTCGGVGGCAGCGDSGGSCGEINVLVTGNSVTSNGLGGGSCGGCGGGCESCSSCCGGCCCGGGGGDGCGSVVMESVESTETSVTSSRLGCGSTHGVCGGVEAGGCGGGGGGGGGCGGVSSENRLKQK